MQEKAGRAALFLAGASATAVLISIAVSQILLSIAFGALLISGKKLRLPRIWWLLALFVVGTVISLAFSADPGAGRPQLRKFFVYLTLVVVFSTFHKLTHVRNLVAAWAALGTVASGVAMAQFGRKFLEAKEQGVNFYQYYVGERVTGFMSHWMTFSGEAMIAFVMLSAGLLFARERNRRLTWALGAAWTLLATGLVIGFTRAVWLGVAAAMLYLVWQGKRKLLWGLPVVIAAMLMVPGVRSRLLSTLRPHGQLDSNQHRVVCLRIGMEMIEAHPLTGVGPEMVKAQYMDYVPADIPKPLPEGWYGHLHNIYIHYAAERGLPTAAALTAMLVIMFLDFRRAAKRLPPGRSDAKFVLHGAAAVVIAVMAAGLFEHNLGDSEVLAMFLAVAAGGYLGVEQSARDNAG